MLKPKEIPPITAGPHDVLDQVALAEDFPLRHVRPRSLKNWRMVERDMSRVPLDRIFND